MKMIYSMNWTKGNALKTINRTEFKKTKIAIKSCSMIKKEGM